MWGAIWNQGYRPLLQTVQSIQRRRNGRHYYQRPGAANSVRAVMDPSNTHLVSLLGCHWNWYRNDYWARCLHWRQTPRTLNRGWVGVSVRILNFFVLVDYYYYFFFLGGGDSDKDLKSPKILWNLSARFRPPREAAREIYYGCSEWIVIQGYTCIRFLVCWRHLPPLESFDPSLICTVRSCQRVVSDGGLGSLISINVKGYTARCDENFITPHTNFVLILEH